MLQLEYRKIGDVRDSAAATCIRSTSAVGPGQLQSPHAVGAVFCRVTCTFALCQFVLRCGRIQGTETCSTKVTEATTKLFEHGSWNFT